MLLEFFKLTLRSKSFVSTIRLIVDKHLCVLNKDQIHKSVVLVERAQNLLPIILSIIGVFIHAMGLLNLIPAPVFLIDLLMLLTDLVVAYGLIKKTLWGYWLAVALYLQQSFMQPYWAYERYISNFFILHPIDC